MQRGEGANMNGSSSAGRQQSPQRPPLNPLPASTPEAAASKKKRHRGGKKRRNRRQSFIAPSESTVNDIDHDRRPSLLDGPRPGGAPSSFYRVKDGVRSNTSLESEALLDHREQAAYRPRRRSNSQAMFNSSAPLNSSLQLPSRANKASKFASMSTPNKSRLSQATVSRYAIDEDDQDPTDRTPLLTGTEGNKVWTPVSGSGRFGGLYGASYFEQRRGSTNSPDVRKRDVKSYLPEPEDEYDVNNPPSMPGSPKIGSLNDVMVPDDFIPTPEDNQDAIIDVDQPSEQNGFTRSSPPDMPAMATDGRRKTKQDLAEMDVCYPGDTGMSEIGEEDTARDHPRSPRRRRRRQWPDLDILDEWATEEKEERNAEQIRAKKMTEPVMVGGRLRNAKQIWHREEDDAPYRYTYFNENFDATIHSRTISELCQFGATFEDLFRPTPPELSDVSSDDEEDPGITSPNRPPSILAAPSARGRASVMSHQADVPRSHSGSLTPGMKAGSHPPTPRRAKRYGPRPTFWLDVLSPTEPEMKVLAKSFGIHQLTVEDIMVQEPREKVELFQNYYFVNYRSFEQDKDNEDYMEPVNIYVIVFRDGVLSFHFSMTPHPANVRRRIRQLNDYMSPSADWISYAIIDDVTDAFAPLVQQVEEDVDDIDDNILELHEHPMDEKHDARSVYSAKSTASTRSFKSTKNNEADEGGRMLRRIGGTRKKVMSLYRLLGNKADVIKGFAKRCTEQWQVAPRSEIGLYLGDIQDHIITMTGNLSHYENLLSRAHSNYLAQINIRTSERAEQTNDVLGKLTVLGTIVLPLNLVTGIWGMNCWVPGQDREKDLTWFFGLIGFMVAFALTCYILARKLYGIV